MANKLNDLAILGVVMLIVCVVMLLLVGSEFFGPTNLQSMAFQLPELGILSLAMAITMLTGGINLSIIASANLSGILAALLLLRVLPPDAAAGLSALFIVLALVVALASAALVGLFNGFLIAVVGVSPILATLGTMILARGLSIVLTRGYVLAGLPPAALWIGNGTVLGIPAPIIIFALAAVAMALLLNRTPTGMGIYMLGSNATACRFAGVPNTRILLRTYTISGLYAGLAALIMIARFNSAKADYGESYLLLTVLASVLGGVSASGGFGRVSGVVLALVILQVISSGLNLLQISAFMTIVLWGAILIAVMVVNFLMGRYQERRSQLRG